MKKIGLFFGGISNESEISIISAKNIIQNFDDKKYQLVLVYWHIDGRFYIIKNLNEISKIRTKKPVPLENMGKFFDVALLMTHGKYGEDGVLQGMLESQKIRYSGCRVLGSSLCMDKTIFKTFLQGQNIQQVQFDTINMYTDTKSEIEKKVTNIKKQFTLPIYIKPSNSGSSVGITKVDKRSELSKAIKEASKHDHKILIEQGLIHPREIEIAVLGNNELIVSEPGELIKNEDFYSFDEKYKLNKTQVAIPARLNVSKKNQIKKMAERIYKLCDCQGFARVDFFLAKGKIYINEINTLPGFTDISMFPMLMKKTGMNYRQLINKIIELAY